METIKSFESGIGMKYILHKDAVKTTLYERLEI